MDSGSLTVRLAVPSDEEDIMDLLRARHLEHGSPCRWDDDRARECVKMGTSRQYGVVGVIRGERGAEASVGLYPATEWFSAENFLHDRWFFVHPHHRQTDHAKQLFAFSRAAAESLDVQLRLTEMGDKTNGLIRFLGRMATPVGGIFNYNPKRDRVAA